VNIPTVVRPYKDELLYGWQLRMAGYNGIQGVHQFQKSFFQDGKNQNVTGQGVRLDYILEMETICQKYAELEEIPSPAEMIKKMTVFMPISAFCTYGYQAMLSQMILRGSLDGLYNFRTASAVDRLYLCPDCIQEDIKCHGEAYYHVWHHFPGITFCAKHKKKLLEMNHNGCEWPWLASSEKDSNQEQKSDTGFESFMKDFSEDPLWIDLHSLQAILIEQMEERGYPEKRPYGKLPYDLQNSLWREEETETILNRIKRISQGTWVNREQAMALTVWLFGRYEEFKKKALPFHKELKADFLELINRRYIMLSEFDIIVKLKCRICGNEFWIHPYAVALGCGCPECDGTLSKKDFFNRQLMRLGDGQYELTEPVDGYGQYTKIMHRTCGKARNMRLSDAVWMERECGCRYEADLTRKQKLVDEKIQGFRVIQYITGKGTVGKVLIHHEVCGRDFLIDLNNFLKFPYCRCCKSRQYSTEKFKQKMLEMVGTEYEAVSPYVNHHTKIKIRHKTCGTITEVLPVSFLYGKRCELCSSSVTCQEIVQMVSECTGGDCRVSAIEKNAFVVENQEKVILKKGARYIMQELLRPTPSDIFPVRIKKPEIKIRTAAIIYMKAKEVCKSKGFFEYKDSDIDRNNTKNAVTWLVKNGYMERIKPGQYKVINNSV